MSDIWLTHLPWVTRQSWPNGHGMSFWPAGRMTTGPRVIICHSTETTGFPGYNNGAAAPHFTINLVSGETRQHVPLNWGSRCLAVSTGGVTDRTVNLTGTIQIEVIGAVTPGYPTQHGHYDLPGRYPTDTVAQGHLARLWRAIHDVTGIPLQLSSYATWVRYPQSYGVRAAQRLSSAQFRDARGILGHQHAPANSHGDGVYGRVVNGLPVDMLTTIERAKGSTPPPPPPPDHTAEIKRVQTLINVIGVADPDLDVDGSAGPLTQSAIKAYAEDFDYSGGHTAWLALIDSMEATVSLLKTIAADTAATRRQTDPTYRPGDNVETEAGSRAHRYRWITRDGRQLYAAEGGHLAAIMLPQILDKLGAQPEEVAEHLRPLITEAIREAIPDANADAVIDALARRLNTTEADA